jgi:GH24 family phage-related lysozyme (muramidase)
MESLQLASDLIRAYEKFEPEAYPDPVHGWEVPTIGYGTTYYSEGVQVKKGDVITPETANLMLKDELVVIRARLKERIPNFGRLNSYREAAILDFAYNAGMFFYGSNGYASITRLLDNPPRWDFRNYVTQQFLKYRRGAPVGLGRRRYSESLMWFGSSPAVAYNRAYDEITSEKDIFALESKISEV